jgi:nucleoside-diphosphate-sugar epimerase
MLAYSYYCSFELPVVTLRPFNVYGPRQSARAVIPSLITQVLSGKKTIQVGNTTATREFNYATDTVSAFELALRAPNIEGETINIGNAHEVSIQELIDYIREISGKSFETIHDQTRFRPEKSEVQRLVSDSSKARKMLNWTPKYGGDIGFKLGLEETITWFSNDANLRKYPDLGYNI